MNTKLKLGIYAGSFDPFHVGHLDIVKQAMNVFDRVCVAKGVNADKIGKLTERYELPSRFLKTIGADVETYDTLLTDVVKRFEPEFDVTLVRGLRNGADLEYEQNIVAFLKEMYPSVKVIAFYCDPKYRHISSSTLRGIRKFSESEYYKYVVSD